MPHTTDRAEGTRTSVAGEFLSQQTTRVEGVPVRALRIGDPDEEASVQSVLLPGERADEFYRFRTGGRYVLDGVVWCRPVADAASVDGTCPECGGDLRERRLVDAYPAVMEARSTLGLDGPFLLVDEEATVRDVDADRVDDWQNRRHPRVERGFVCIDCGDAFEPHEVRGPVVEEVYADASVNYSMAPADEALGLATGGAKDATSFRENVRAGYTPQPDALAYEGLFHDYRFPTNPDVEADTDALFRPTYSRAVSENPVTGVKERYLSVGLDSNRSVADFERPALDLVAVLDVSGSMSSAFSEYYYDAQGTRQRVDSDRGGETKLEAAAASLCALTEQLTVDDRLGVVLFDQSAHVAKPLRVVGETDMPAIRRHVREVRAGGGTDMSSGFLAATELLTGSDPGRERRVVFMTDAMPNLGTTRTSGLVDLVADAAGHGVYTTFVGMGLDENAELVADLSRVRGANHYFVHSPEEFERRLGDEFDYVVTPLVFDLSLEVDGAGFEVADVYGTPNDPAGDAVLSVTTLFPSPTRDGESRGGVILLRLEPTRGGDETGDVAAVDAGSVDLAVSWTERDGTRGETSTSITVPAAECVDDDGVRKAVALTRYGRVLREWARTVRGGDGLARGGESGDDVDDWQPPGRTRTRHERGSVPLSVPAGDADRFETLASYLERERDALGDETLDRELDVLEHLLAAAGRGVAE